MERQRQWQKGDALAIAFVVALAALILFVFWKPRANARAPVAEVYRNGTLVAVLPLNEDAELKVTGAYENTVTVRDGAVAVTHTTCPGADCVHTGWIASAGSSIFCLPNRLEVRVVGDGGVDIVVSEGVCEPGS